MIESTSQAAPLRVVTMRYADLVMRFEAGDAGTAFTMPPEYEEFRVPDDTPAVVRVTWREGALEPPPGEPVLGGEVWNYYGGDEGGTLVFRRGVGVPYAAAHFAADLRSAEVVQDSSALGSRLANVGMYPLTEILASRFLSAVDAVDLHASAALYEGSAFLFTGHSGAGKTTISELAIAEGATVLSDDRTIIGVREDVPTAWGTPWHGTGRRSSSRTAPIAGIFLLVQAREERVVPIPPSRAFKELFVRLIHQRLSPQETQAALATLEQVVRTTPVWELHFRPVPAAFHLAVATAAAQAGR